MKDTTKKRVSELRKELKELQEERQELIDFGFKRSNKSIVEIDFKIRSKNSLKRSLQATIYSRQ